MINENILRKMSGGGAGMGERQEVGGGGEGPNKEGERREGENLYSQTTKLLIHTQKRIQSADFWAVASSLLVFPCWDDTFHLEYLETK